MESGRGPIDLTHAHEEIPRHFEAQKAAGHARRDFEKIRYDALVEAAKAFLGCDDGDGVPDGAVFVADLCHSVDLESSP